MGANQKIYIFAIVVAGAAIALWGVKGLVGLLPGPNPR